MKIIRIAGALSAGVLILTAAACSEKKPDVPLETASQSAAVTYDLSQAVNAFNEQTITAEYSDGETIYAAASTHLFPSVSAGNKEQQSSAETPRATEGTTVKADASTAAPTKETVRVMVSEGETLTQIFKKLEVKGVASFDELMTTAQTYDYSYYPLVAKIPSNSNRCFRLEGYLFPDTYEFFKNENAVSVLRKFFDNADAKWTKEYQKQAKALGYTRDEILNIASIIQREAANKSQMSDVSSVIHNRLNSSTYPSLQCNSTLDYVTNSVKSHVDATLAEIYANAYNTYRVEGLPPGPICNPGKDAIEAALYPGETNYYFFVHNNNGKIYLSENYAQFQKDCVQAAKDNAS